MFEYCSVTYACLNRGWTQEIYWVLVDGKKVKEWKNKHWTEFLNYMGQQQWELVSTQAFARQGADHIAVAYFKRLI